MSKQERPKRRTRRLNVRALVVIVGLLAVGVPGLVILKGARDRYGKTAFLAEARTQIAKGKAPLALGYINRYLELAPEDAEALDLKAKLLYDSAVSSRDPAQAMDALKAHSPLIASGGDPARLDQARRRMIELNLMVPGRGPSALELALQLTGNDAQAHRLKARAWGRVGMVNNDADALDKARQEFLAAEAKDPGDVPSAEEFADIYRTRLEKPEKGLEVLDNAVRNTAKSPEKHAAALLARARYYSALSQAATTGDHAVDAIKKAEADVDQATHDDPTGLVPRLVAAEVALQARDYDAARRHLEAIAPDRRGDGRVKKIKGLIELAESRPNDAIQTWRSGLLQIGGGDAQLTWQLALILLELGRVSEAEPLIEQYLRLSGAETPDDQYRYLHAFALFRKNRPAEATAELEGIVRADKQLERKRLYTLGQCYEATRRTAKAVEAYQQAAAASHGWSAPWIALSRLQAVENPADGLATLQKGLTLIPNDPQLLTAQAELVYREQMKRPRDQRSMVDVEKVLEQAGEASPGSVEVAMVRAQFYASSGAFENALELLKAATEINPRSPDLWVARANLMAKMSRAGDAEALLREATTRAGEKAVFYTSRANYLAMRGEIRAARGALVEGLGKVDREQKPLLYKNLGDLDTVLKDYGRAADAYDEWARLQPENPEPRLGLFRVAIARVDDAGVAAAIENLKKVAGERSYFWRLARVEDLMRDRKASGGGAGEPDPKRVEEAEALVREIQKNDPQLPVGYALEGKLKESHKDTDAAILAYRKAADLGDVDSLKTLIGLLVREHRDADLDRLRAAMRDRATGIDQIAALQSMAGGDTRRAEDLAQKAVEGDPQGLNTRVWQAEVLQALGKPKQAEERARALISERPTDPAPWLLLMMLQVSNGEKSAAADTVEQIRQKVKTERPELLMAQCYRAVGDLPRAAESMREALRRSPNDPGVQSSAVLFYEQLGRREEFEETLRAMLRRDPSASWATRKLALSLAGRPNDRAAWDEAVRLVGPDRRPNDVPDDQIIRAAVYATGPEPAHRRKAIEIYESLLNELPDRADLHEQVSRILIITGDLPGALGHAAKAARGDNAGAAAIGFYAGLLVMANHLTAAEEQLARAERLDPDGLQVAELRARILVARGKADEGVALLEKAFDERAATPEGLITGEKMVQLLSGLNQPEAAERVARKVAEIAPPGRCQLAELVAGRGKPDEAAAELEKVARSGEPAAAASAAMSLASRPGSDPRWPDLAERYLTAAAKGGDSRAAYQNLERLAMIRHFQGKYQDEIATYRKMLEMNPPNYVFLNNMAWTLSEELGDPEQGLKYADEAVKRVGAVPFILDTRGVILTRLGEYARAAKDLEAAVKDVRDPSVDYHLARVYFKLGKTEEARKYRDRALKAGLAPEKLQRSERAGWDEVMKAS